MASENVVQRDIWAEASPYSTLFRLNTGKAWVSGGGKPYRTKTGDMVVPSGRPISIGLAMINREPVVGAHDLLGWTTIEITPEMVGKKVAVITTIETKKTTGGRRSPEQVNFCNVIETAGGISGFANKAGDFVEILQRFLTKLRS